MWRFSQVAQPDHNMSFTADPEHAYGPGVQPFALADTVAPCAAIILAGVHC